MGDGWKDAPDDTGLWWRAAGAGVPMMCSVYGTIDGLSACPADGREVSYSTAPHPGTRWHRVEPPADTDPRDERIAALETQLAVVTKSRDALRRGVVANAGRFSRGRMVRWAYVADATGFGSTSSTELCTAAGFDPHEMIGSDDREDAT